MKKERFRTVEFNKSIIDDLSRFDEDLQGIPYLFTNQDIRKMLRLAKVGKNDIFFDLGSGWGQNLIIALTEFHVKKAIGIENNSERNKISLKRLERLEKIGITKEQFTVIDADFEYEFLKGKVKEHKLYDATCIFYGLSTSKSLLDKIEKNMKKGTKFVCYYDCLFPEIMPDKNGIDYPFFVYTFPFQKTRSELMWLKTIIQKKHSTYNSKKKPTKEELWDELRHDYDVEMSDSSYVDEYQKRLEKLLKKK